MNQTSLVGRPLAALTAAVVNFAERRGVWSGPLTSSSPELARLWASPSSNTGIGVSEVTALTYSTVWACVNNISTDVASLPLILYKRLQDGGKERLTDHKLYKLLHDEPNPEMSSMTFRGVVQAHALTWGNGYAEIVRDGAGRAVALWPITPDRVTVRRDGRGVYYEVSRSDGGFDVVRAENMLHIPGLGYDGTTGYNLVAKARESIALGLATERFGGTFFGNGATFGGVFEHPGRMSEPAMKNFRESVNAQHQGVEKAHKFIVVEEGMKYQKLGIEPDHAQFLETRVHQVEEICRFFRMPPHKVQHLLRSTNNNIEHQGIEYYADTLRPWCVRWEQEIKRKLVAPSERMIQFAEHKIEGVLRGDLQSRYASYAVGRQWGWLSADDICEFENLNPLPKGQGKIYLVPMNMSPADRINDIVDKQVAPDPKPVAPAPAASDKAEEAAHMVDAIRAAVLEVETRIADTTGKITLAEAEALKWKDSASAFAVEIDTYRATLATEHAESNRLKAVLLEATERADRLALEQEALTLSVTTAEERVTAADDVIAKTSEQLEAARLAASTLGLECGELRAHRDQAAAQLGQFMADHQAAVLALETATEAERATAEQRVTELRTLVSVAEQQRDTHQASLLTLQSALVDAKAQAVTLSGELDALRAEAETTAKVAEASSAAAESAIADAMTARTAAEHAAVTLATERAAHAEKQAEVDRLTQAFAIHRRALRTAHRYQITDVVARLIYKETERARKNQATPEKLLAWAESFYLLHEDNYVDALRSVMRAHLVQIGSPADVDAYTRAKVHPHLTSALTQLRTVCHGDPSEFHVLLERLLTRWLEDRPAALADVVAQDDIETDEYLRSQTGEPLRPEPPAPPQIHIHNHHSGGGSKKVTFKRNVDGSPEGAVIEDED